MVTFDPAILRAFRLAALAAAERAKAPAEHIEILKRLIAET